MKITTLISKLSFLIVFILFGNFISVYSATLFETFDSPSVAATNNNGVQITYPSGNWFTYGITKPTTATENDRINGTYSIRMRGLAGKSSMYMMFDKAGAGVVSFNYGSYSTHSGGIFKLQKSINQGSSWEDVGTEVTVSAWNGSFKTYSAVVNYNGNIRFRIQMTETTNANTQVNIDDFQITDYNVDQTAIPVITPPTEVYETTQNVTITSATSGATIYYTLDGTTPTTGSTVYNAGTPIVVSETKTVKAIAVAAGKENSRVETAVINIPITVTNLAALYTYMLASGTNLQYYKYTGQAIVSYAYITSTGIKYIFAQDNTAGILMNDNFKKLANTYSIGDRITGVIAQVTNVNDSPQLYPYTDFTVSSTGNSITPDVITLANVSSNLYKLITFNELFFDEANGTKTFGPNSPYIVHDASTPTTSSVAFRVPNMTPNPDYLTAPNNIMPASKKVTCIVSRYSTTVYQIFARSLADFASPVNRVEELPIRNLTVLAGKVTFETLEAEQISVYAITGQLVKSFVSQVGINSFELNNGVYIVKTSSGIAKIIVR